MSKDSIDFLLQQWTTELSGINPWPTAVVGRIFRLSTLLKRATEEALMPFGLTFETFEIIAALRRTGPPYQLKPSALYGAMVVTTGAITNRIDRTEALGLISRSPDPNDRRGVIVTLEPKGIALAEQAFAAYYGKVSGMMAFLGASEREEIAAMLSHLLAGLEASQG